MLVTLDQSGLNHEGLSGPKLKNIRGYPPAMSLSSPMKVDNIKEKKSRLVVNFRKEIEKGK